jgi:hypothetical protein
MKRPEPIFAAQLMFRVYVFGLSVLLTAPAWSQADNTRSSQPARVAVTADEASIGLNSNVPHDAYSDRMLTPPPVSGQAYPTSAGSEERSNYLHAGLSFTSAYTDNAIGSVSGHPVSDFSYSLFPTVALNETTTRMHGELSYAPGFTFYQRTSSLNQADQNASINFQYRLSPHVTFSAHDTVQKTSNVFNQPDLGSSTGITGSVGAPNFSIVAPITEQLRNSGTVGVTYQFARNAMLGGNGTFSNLSYPNPAQVSGLSDAATQSGSAFYALRIARSHYIGAMYQYQRLASYPTKGVGETQTHAALLFYTLYWSSQFSMSFFGGPQHSDTLQPPQQTASSSAASQARSGIPAVGASLNLQERLTNFSASYAHVIAGGGGLIAAVKMDSAAAVLRQQITKRLSGSIGGSYVQNDVLGTYVAGNQSGHSISATASLQEALGEHLSVQLGYTRLHQEYSGVSILASTPDTNREFISLSYYFSRPLGR